MFLYWDPGYFRIFPEGSEKSKQVKFRPPQSFNPLYYSWAIIGARLDHPISCGVHHLEFLSNFMPSLCAIISVPLRKSPFSSPSLSVRAHRSPHMRPFHHRSKPLIVPEWRKLDFFLFNPGYLWIFAESSYTFQAGESCSASFSYFYNWQPS